MGILLDAATPIRSRRLYASYLRRGWAAFSLRPRPLQSDLRHHCRHDLECCEGQLDSLFADDDAPGGGIRGSLLLCSLENPTGRCERREYKVSAAG